MLSFGLKIAWFVLSLTGLLGCWTVLLAFGRVVGSLWGPFLFGFGNLLLQGMFCLGMIYRMDPFAMPRSFCIAQTIIITSGVFVLTGVSSALSLATTMAVLKPKMWADGTRALRWRPIYVYPAVVFPIVASTIHAVLVLTLNSAHPSDDMHCDSTSPEWVRFFGYAGVPFVVSWISIYLTIKSIIRVHKTNQHLQRARPDVSRDDFTSSRPRKQRTRRVSFTGRASHGPSVKRELVSPAIASLAPAARKFHLPFRAPGPSPISEPRSSSICGPLEDQDDETSSVVSFPTFAHPGSGSTLTEGRLPGAANQPKADEMVEEPELHDLGVIHVVDSGDESGDWNEDKADLRSEESDIGKDEFPMTEAMPSTSRTSAGT
ncbi:hypothetical protein GALMADRAFT_751821 [Galerina marginata CBS 339.88]|uniref:Uncharacterized protein n=1 Tax=Galerina marginata (strain CBS 339.88) TaxID=685588 RepID=A0A067SNM7_GALM3|nr:hypothetical protein GALMADRAFT_751821 [Galerina marginata CBS 339.88]